MKPMTPEIATRYALLLLVVALLVALFRPLLQATMPFILALLLASLIEPLVVFLVKRTKLPRSGAVVFSLAIVIISAGYVLTFSFAKISAELVDLLNQLPKHRSVVSDLVEGIMGQLHTFNEGLPEEIAAQLQIAVEDLLKRATDFVTEMVKLSVNRILAFASSLPQLLLALLVTLVATYFMSKDRDRLVQSIFGILPAKWRKPLETIEQNVLTDVASFVKHQFVLFAVQTALASTVLLLYGARYWMVLGFLLGILDLIPVVGPGVVLFPWAAASLLLGNVPMALALVLLFLVMLTIRQLLQAVVIGDSIGVHPLPMLIALYTGFHLMGVSGLIIAPLLVIVGKALLSSIDSGGPPAHPPAHSTPRPKARKQ